MKAVTIDNLDIKDHLRWAQDQEVLEKALVTEAAIVALHPEILGMSLIYSSKFEELFELQKRNQHWAFFAPPINFHLFSKRFFSYRLFPGIHLANKEEESSQEGEQQEEEQEEGAAFDRDLLQAMSRIKKMSPQNASLFEKDKSAMLNLLDSIKWINDLLKQIHGRKLQYQKG